MFDNEGFIGCPWKNKTELSHAAASNCLNLTIPTYPDEQAVGLSGRKSSLFKFEILKKS